MTEDIVAPSQSSSDIDSKVEVHTSHYKDPYVDREVAKNFPPMEVIVPARRMLKRQVVKNSRQ